MQGQNNNVHITMEESLDVTEYGFKIAFSAHNYDNPLEKYDE